MGCNEGITTKGKCKSLRASSSGNVSNNILAESGKAFENCWTKNNRLVLKYVVVRPIDSSCLRMVRYCTWKSMLIS